MSRRATRAGVATERGPLDLLARYRRGDEVRSADALGLAWAVAPTRSEARESAVAVRSTQGATITAPPAVSRRRSSRASSRRVMRRV